MGVVAPGEEEEGMLIITIYHTNDTTIIYNKLNKC